jgi:hypothetical protein
MSGKKQQFYHDKVIKKLNEKSMDIEGIIALILIPFLLFINVNNLLFGCLIVIFGVLNLASFLYDIKFKIAIFYIYGGLYEWAIKKDQKYYYTLVILMKLITAILSIFAGVCFIITSN